MKITLLILLLMTQSQRSLASDKTPPEPQIEVFSQDPAIKQIPVKFWKRNGAKLVGHSNDESKALSPLQRDRLLRSAGLWADLEFQDHFEKDLLISRVRTQPQSELKRLYPELSSQKLATLKKILR